MRRYFVLNSAEIPFADTVDTSIVSDITILRDVLDLKKVNS